MTKAKWEEIKKNADKIIGGITLEDAAKLPGLIGKIAPKMLEVNGFYSYNNTTTGEKILLTI